MISHTTDATSDSSDEGSSWVPLLEVDGLTTEFRTRHSVIRAVNDVSFSAAGGECVGLVGESGCGKSTVGLSIMRLLPPAGHIRAGEVRLSGRNLASLNDTQMGDIRGNEVAMVFQDPMTSLNPTMTIGKQIARPLRRHWQMSTAAARQRTLEVLDQVGMPRASERIDAYPHQLSGGLRQRVMIAMALACKPQVLVADEPTTALDVTIQSQILDLLDDLRVELGMAVVLITHDMGVVAERAQRVVVLYAGNVVEAASTREFFVRTGHPYSEALIESIPRLERNSREQLFSIPGLPPDLSEPLVGCAFRPRCRNATGRCAEERPSLETRSGVGHRIACFHPVVDEEAPSRAVRTSEEGARGHDDRQVLLECVDLVKEYPVTAGVLQRRVGTVHAVSGVSLSVQEGGTLGLVGESGCGKTTLGRMMVGLERPTSGYVRFGGETTSLMNSRQLRRRRRGFQLIFQDPYSSLDPRMRVGATIREPLLIQGIGGRAEQRARVNDLVGEVGLPGSAVSRYPHEFSGGQRQRIGIARALSLSPRLVVADEPVSALDVSIQAQVLNLLKSLQTNHGLTFVVISHDLAVVRYIADTIGVMYLGKLVEVGSVDEVYRRAAHHYTRGLIDIVPVPDPERARSSGRSSVRGEPPSAVNPPSGCRFRTRCPAAQDICATEEPVLRAFGPTHRAACHFPLKEPTE